MNYVGVVLERFLALRSSVCTHIISPSQRSSTSPMHNTSVCTLPTSLPVTRTSCVTAKFFYAIVAFLSFIKMVCIRFKYHPLLNDQVRSKRVIDIHVITMQETCTCC
eukprot:GHVQ01009110.1.p1 GENE.GHVQ01009110.1~~GHVQ01009110.1.p1  ORF type:complete len:107 (+),score=2.39 GHVQ01009110.1:1053-1373(+)